MSRHDERGIAAFKAAPDSNQNTEGRRGWIEVRPSAVAEQSNSGRAAGALALPNPSPDPLSQHALITMCGAPASRPAPHRQPTAGDAAQLSTDSARQSARYTRRLSMIAIVWSIAAAQPSTQGARPPDATVTRGLPHKPPARAAASSAFASGSTAVTLAPIVGKHRRGISQRPITRTRVAIDESRTAWIRRATVSGGSRNRPDTVRATSTSRIGHRPHRPPARMPRAATGASHGLDDAPVSDTGRGVTAHPPCMARASTWPVPSRSVAVGVHHGRSMQVLGYDDVMRHIVAAPGQASYPARVRYPA